ncbi:MAG: hypothetical protein LBQ22_02615 [Bacteroidales bacterium]|jgi:ligand-binding sensor domain-containing protein|nr:hypothetical protein [Bacteroidales bacterium]
MSKINYVGYFSIFFIISFFSFGQVGLGQWRDHLPYTNGVKLVLAKNDVYMVTEVGLLKYNKLNYEAEKVSKITGLNDVDIRGMAYSKELDCLVIGYANGNIDIIYKNDIINISDIKRKSINSEKSINTIAFFENNAYLGCGFGIVVLDLARKEIKETWYIGENGSFLSVNDLKVNGEYIYAATNNGVYKGNLRNYLLNYSNWEIISDNTQPQFSWMSGKTYDKLVYFDNKLVVNYHDESQTNADTLMVYNGEEWTYFNNTMPLHDVYSISCDENTFLVCMYGDIKLFDKTFTQYRNIWTYAVSGVNYAAMPSMAILDPDNSNELWIADKNAGLVRYFFDSWGSVGASISGPLSSKIFDLDSYGDKVYGVAGGYNLSMVPQWVNSMVYKFEGERWTTQTHSNTPGLSVSGDLVRIAIDPKDPSHYFCASWQDGLYEFRNNELYKLHNEENSTLKKITGYNWVRTGGIAFDKKGNLWVTISLAMPNLHVLTPEGNWYAFDYSPTVNSSYNMGKIIVTQSNNKWAIISGGNGIIVFNENGTFEDKSDDKYRKINIINEEGEPINNNVNAIAEDKNGYIWVGTDKGVAVYYNPDNVFTSGSFTARQIKIPRNDGTNNADLLLQNEIVTTINVDGANKKWFGTRSGGVFYTSDDGIEEFYNFNTDNSPLLDNNILCSTIVPETGEVFFGTTKGIISFKNLATEGKENYTDVYAYPNPVRENYDGPIVIKGLVAGSYVKITDITGSLVYEVKSDGGQAVWYGKDMTGNKVKTGIYLVFSTNETGSKTDITKIMVIN